MPIARNIRFLSWLNFCTDFVFFAPVAIIYFAHVTGSYALGMSIFSLAYVSSAIFEVTTGIVFGIASIALGVLADRFDARTALVVANILLLTPLFFYRKIFLHEQTEAPRAFF